MNVDTKKKAPFVVLFFIILYILVGFGIFGELFVDILCTMVIGTEIVYTDKQGIDHKVVISA